MKIRIFDDPGKGPIDEHEVEKKPAVGETIKVAGNQKEVDRVELSESSDYDYKVFVKDPHRTVVKELPM